MPNDTTETTLDPELNETVLQTLYDYRFRLCEKAAEIKRANGENEAYLYVSMRLKNVIAAIEIIKKSEAFTSALKNFLEV